MRRWIVGLVAVLVLGYAVAATVVLVFFPAERDESAPTPVTVTRTVTLEREDVWQLGEPPTVDWPTEPPCPESLTSVCAGEALTLIATVNMRRGSAANGAFSPERRLVLCQWPMPDPGSCDVVGVRGAIVRGESALYALPD